MRGKILSPGCAVREEVMSWEEMREEEKRIWGPKESKSEKPSQVAPKTKPERKEKVVPTSPKASPPPQKAEAASTSPEPAPVPPAPQKTVKRHHKRRNKPPAWMESFKAAIKKDDPC
jgi:hypothetical protein